MLTDKKARYPYAKVYDGPIETVLNDLKRKRLNQPPCEPRSQSPRIILLSLPEREKALQQWERSLEDAEIFQTMPLIISAFTQRPDFIVLSLPAWVLVERAWLELFKGIWTLLTSRYAINIRRVSFTDYGLAREGCMLVIVASCVPTPIPWDDIFAKTTPNPKVTVQSVIKDLGFSNSRSTTEPQTTGLICKNSQTLADVYNHQTLALTTPFPLPQETNLNTPLSLPRLTTAIHPLTLPPSPNPAGSVLFPFLPAAIRPRPDLPRDYMQPVKNPRGGDLLSVREIARVQGFPDDFLFLGMVGWQRSEVLGAWPVVVGRGVAVGVRGVVREFGGVVGMGVNTAMGTGENVGASTASTSGQQKQSQVQKQAQKGQKRARES